MKLAAYRPANAYDQLSLRDLLDARDQYHIHLMQHPNVVATAVGRYRIRKKDSWPTKTGPGKIHGHYPARSGTQRFVRIHGQHFSYS